MGTQLSKIFSALAEDLGLISTTHTVAYSYLWVYFQGILHSLLTTWCTDIQSGKTPI